MNDYGFPKENIEIEELSSRPEFAEASNTGLNLEDLAEIYRNREPISALVVYDAEGARLALEAGIEVLVASFSNGMPKGVPCEGNATVADTIEAIRTIRAVNEYSFLVGDIPQECYRKGDNLVRVAKQLLLAGAQAVKAEGGARMAETVRRLVDAGIPVIGHIGYTPKTNMLMQVRGNTFSDYQALQQDAEKLIDAGVIALVLELVKSDAAAHLTQRLTVPTIGIYSGGSTSGQALVLNDLLDRTTFDIRHFPKGKPKSIGRWAGPAESRVQQFHRQVKNREFPFLMKLQLEQQTRIDEQWTPDVGSHAT